MINTHLKIIKETAKQYSSFLKLKSIENIDKDVFNAMKVNTLATLKKNIQINIDGINKLLKDIK